MSLSHDDVEQLLKVLDASQFDELHLETGGTKIMLRRRGASGGTRGAVQPVRPAAPPAGARTTRDAVAAAPASQAPDAAPDASGLAEIRASMLGTFYRAPKPGAAPFVEVGSEVTPETTVGIIEVMKLMNPMNAMVAGEVVEILVGDGQMVEYDQVLMRVRTA